MSLLEEIRWRTQDLCFVYLFVHVCEKDLTSKCALVKVRGHIVGLGSLLLPDWILGLELSSSHLLPGVFTESSNETSVLTNMSNCAGHGGATLGKQRHEFKAILVYRIRILCALSRSLSLKLKSSQ